MNKATALNQNGEQVTAAVGQAISFKADIEQGAIVKAIRCGGWDGRQVQVRVDIEDGEYRAKDQWIDLADCWN